MKATAIQGMIKFRAGLLILLVAIALFNSGVMVFGAVASSPARPDLLVGITIADSFTEADVAYLQNSLQLLHDYLPEWYDYVVKVKPFRLTIDYAAGERGLAADAKCCDARGNGSITFGDHFGGMPTSRDTDDQTSEARQIEFLSTLVHEVTHIRDRRTGLVQEKVDVLGCVTAEKSAYGKEVEFKRAMASVKIGNDPAVAEIYRRVAEKQFNADSSAFTSGRWKLFCLRYIETGE